MDKWVEINSGVDQQRDFMYGMYAQVGPDADGKWSWMLLRARDGDPSSELAWGVTHDEEEAKTRAISAASVEEENEWFRRHPGFTTD